MYITNNKISQSQFYRGRITNINLFVILCLTISCPLTVHAQSSGLTKGDRVKISAPTISPKNIIGTVGGISPSVTTLVTKDSTFYIPHSSIKRIEISNGQKRATGKGALIGAVAGGLILGISSAVANSDPHPCHEEPDPGIFCGAFEYSDGEAIALGTVIGVLGGGIVGAFIGTSFRTERWQRTSINVEAGVIPSNDRRIQFAPTISFNVSLSKP